MRLNMLDRSLLNSGLIFAIPLDRQRFGFGQLVYKQFPIWYMVAFDKSAPGPSLDNPVEIVNSEVIFGGNFFDVLIRNGRWPIVGTAGTPPVRLPEYKLLVDGVMRVASWDRSELHDATYDEVKRLTFRANYAPMILENALRAHFGMGTWKPVYSEISMRRAR
jgi:hypothetical protein